MVPITIGVPVYNGADLLDESLACLARQTFRDFKVLIFDNASTDAHRRDRAGLGGARRAISLRATAEKCRRHRQFSRCAARGGKPVVHVARRRRSERRRLSSRRSIAWRRIRRAASWRFRPFVSHDLDGGRRRLTPPPDIPDPASVGWPNSHVARQPSELVLRPVGPRNGLGRVWVRYRELSLRLRLRPSDALRADHRRRRQDDGQNPIHSAHAPHRRDAAPPDADAVLADGRDCAALSAPNCAACARNARFRRRCEPRFARASRSICITPCRRC